MAGISGAGAEVTALAESLQAYACAARQFLGKDLTSIGDITLKTTKDAQCDRTLKQCFDGLNDKWFHSVVVTANKIAKDFKITKSSSFVYYRGGDLVNSIYKEFGKFRKTSGITGDDKWNPADIWMAKKNFKFKNDWKSLTEYNAYIYDQFEKKNLVGISLKLVPKGDAKSKIFNDGKPLNASFTSFKLGVNPADSKDIYLTFLTEAKKSAEIQLRNFSSRPVTSSWQGEIKGKSAAGGKIGGGILYNAAIECGVPRASLMQPSAFTSKIEKPPEQVFKDFVNMYMQLLGMPANGVGTTKGKQLLQIVKTKHAIDKTWWMSKYLGVSYCYAIAKAKKTNEVINWLYGYGSSATKNSSIFIKYSD